MSCTCCWNSSQRKLTWWKEIVKARQKAEQGWQIFVDIVLQDAPRRKNCCSKTGKSLHCKVSTKASNSLTFFSWTASFSGNESWRGKERCRSVLIHNRQTVHLKRPCKAKIPFLSNPTPLHHSGLPLPHAQNQESSDRIQTGTLEKALWSERVLQKKCTGAWPCADAPGFYLCADCKISPSLSLGLTDQKRDQFWGSSFGSLNDNYSKHVVAAFSLKRNTKVSEAQVCYKQICICLKHISEERPLVRFYNVWFPQTEVVWFHTKSSAMDWAPMSMERLLSWGGFWNSR